VHFGNTAWKHTCNGQFSFFAWTVNYRCKNVYEIITECTNLLTVGLANYGCVPIGGGFYLSIGKDRILELKIKVIQFFGAG
jgi:hypothetical protein